MIYIVDLPAQRAHLHCWKVVWELGNLGDSPGMMRSEGRAIESQETFPPHGEVSHREFIQDERDRPAGTHPTNATRSSSAPLRPSIPHKDLYSISTMASRRWGHTWRVPDLHVHMGLGISSLGIALGLAVFGCPSSMPRRLTNSKPASRREFAAAKGKRSTRLLCWRALSNLTVAAHAQPAR